jgi:uncharacterized protein YceH (UPF0502 family)
MAEAKRGGARPGSGRKAGEANKKTRAIADKAAKEGITPLEVMLKTMTALMERADLAKSLKVLPGEKEPSYLELMVDAASVAKDAAPYMHPRLQAIEHSGGMTIRTLADELAELNAQRNTKGDS